jgi:hypothetical protein
LDGPDHGLWLAERDPVSRSFCDDLAAAFRQRDLVLLQLPPRRVAPPSGRQDDHGNVELPSRGFHFFRTLTQVGELVHGRLVGRRAKARGQCQASHFRGQAGRWRPKGDAHESKDSERREKGDEGSHAWDLHVLILVGSIDEHEAGDPFRMLGGRHPCGEAPDRRADEHDRIGETGVVQQLRELTCDPPRRPR